MASRTSSKDRSEGPSSRSGGDRCCRVIPVLTPACSAAPPGSTSPTTQPLPAESGWASVWISGPSPSPMGLRCENATFRGPVPSAARHPWSMSVPSCASSPASNSPISRPSPGTAPSSAPAKPPRSLTTEAKALKTAVARSSPSRPSFEVASGSKIGWSKAAVASSPRNQLASKATVPGPDSPRRTRRLRIEAGQCGATSFKSALSSWPKARAKASSGEVHVTRVLTPGRTRSHATPWACVITPATKGPSEELRTDTR